MAKAQEIIRKGNKIITIRPDGSKDVGTINEEPSLTDQSQKDACDVNLILAKYMKTGQIPHMQARQGQYVDVSGYTDLIAAFEQVHKAVDAFEALPAELRFKLNNDPVKLVEYLNDPKNDDEAIKLGIKVKKQVAPEVGGATPTPAPAELPKS